MGPDEIKWIVSVVKEGGTVGLAIAFGILWWRADKERRLSQAREFKLAVGGVDAMNGVKRALEKIEARAKRRDGRGK